MERLQYRHELKIEVSLFEYMALKNRLDVIMHLDEHCGSDDMYSISSLYFDNVYDKALSEKLRGVDKREKFRLRYYDNDVGFIRLEKKQKSKGKCLKTSCVIDQSLVRGLIAGDYDELRKNEAPLVRELVFKMDTQGLRPRTIVNYNRRAYVYQPGNVRVTFDMNLTTGLDPSKFLTQSNQLVDGDDQIIIMEVKYDEFIPSFIADILNAKSGRVQAFSKYAQCRKYN